MDERVQFVASWRAECGTLQRVGVRRSNDSSCGRGEATECGLLEGKTSKQFDLRRRAAHQDRKITGFGSPGARADVIIGKCTLIQADGYAFCFAGFQ